VPGRGKYHRNPLHGRMPKWSRPKGVGFERKTHRTTRIEGGRGLEKGLEFRENGGSSFFFLGGIFPTYHGPDQSGKGRNSYGQSRYVVNHLVGAGFLGAG